MCVDAIRQSSPSLELVHVAFPGLQGAAVAPPCPPASATAVVLVEVRTRPGVFLSASAASVRRPDDSAPPPPSPSVPPQCLLGVIDVHVAPQRPLPPFTLWNLDLERRLESWLSSGFVLWSTGK